MVIEKSIKHPKKPEKINSFENLCKLVTFKCYALADSKHNIKLTPDCLK